MSNMQVTVRYGIDQLTRTFEVPVTIGQLRRDGTIRSALGFGDNTRMLINGVPMSDDVNVPNGATVVVETAANTKANPATV